MAGMERPFQDLTGTGFLGSEVIQAALKDANERQIPVKQVLAEYAFLGLSALEAENSSANPL